MLARPAIVTVATMATPAAASAPPPPPSAVAAFAVIRCAVGALMFVGLFARVTFGLVEGLLDRCVGLLALRFAVAIRLMG
jgi:hypothetical protein